MSKFYRIVESLLKSVNRIENKSKNNKLKIAYRSAIYNTSSKNDLIFSIHKKINYILKNNEEISKQIFINGEFDFRVLKKGLKFLNNKKKFLINIGSHVGTTLIPALKENLFEECIAFEPSKNNFRLLTANIYINKLDEKVRAYHLALSNKISSGYLQLFHSTNSADYRVVNSSKNAEKIKVDILDNYTSKMTKKNSLIFLDAQGHEPEIFQGGKKTLNKKIPIIFELDLLLIKKENQLNLFNSIKHYSQIVDLENSNVKKMNKEIFFKILNKYLSKKSFTNVMVF